MSRPVIFTISAAWDQEASVWSGHCDDIPAAADAPTLDESLAKISAMALDLLPDNHRGCRSAQTVGWAKALAGHFSTATTLVHRAHQRHLWSYAIAGGQRRMHGSARGKAVRARLCP